MNILLYYLTSFAPGTGSTLYDSCLLIGISMAQVHFLFWNEKLHIF